jgi:hypothetical protein
MNEKIKLLAEQAGLGQERWNTTEQFNSFLEKFAERIIQECLKEIETAAYHDSCENWEYGYNAGLNKAKELIVKHFEVEE